MNFDEPFKHVIAGLERRAADIEDDKDLKDECLRAARVLRDRQPGKMRNWSASVTARYIPMLAPFLAGSDYMGARLELRGLRIEPHPAGGAYLIATDGRTMGVIHDKDARVTEAGTVALTDMLVEKCRMPKVPDLWSEGDLLDMPAPDWMVPETIQFSGIGALVFSKDKDAEGVLWHEIAAYEKNIHRDNEYRLYDKEYIGWRKVFCDVKIQSIGNVTINPVLLNKFQEVGSVRISEYTPGGCSFWFTGPDGPLIVRALGVPEFIGLIMPMTHLPEERISTAMPDWLDLESAGAEALPEGETA